MHQLVRGVYRKGHIDIDGPIPLKDNTPINFWIETESEKKDTSELGVYDLGKDLDNLNIRDLAYED
jgi:hypothetical protein